MGQPSLAVPPWVVVQGCTLSSRRGWLHWECVTCISMCYSDSYPPFLTSLLHGWDMLLELYRF